MKKILVLLIAMLSLTSGAQTVAPLEDFLKPAYLGVSNIYFKDVNNLLDDYVGEWEVSTAMYFFKIKIEKRIKVEQGAFADGTKLYKKKIFRDMLVVDFWYKENNQTIYNTYVYIPTVTKPTNNGRYIKGGNVLSDGSIWISYREPTLNECGRSRIGELVLSVSQSDLNTLTWKSTEKPLQRSCSGGMPDDSVFKMPSLATLTKLP